MATGPTPPRFEFGDVLTQREDEALFARGYDGQLIRYVGPRVEDFDKDVKLFVDGVEVTVKKAMPLRDAQGNVVYDADGQLIPRDTTIYDAIRQRYLDVGGPNPVPILCHQDHMQPAGVCRVCSVQVVRREPDGKERADDKLSPACRHPVSSDVTMVVHTAASPEAKHAQRVQKSVRTILELLAANSPQGQPAENAPDLNELTSQVRRFDARPERLLHVDPLRRQPDNSSDLVAVNHEACILCNRCIRACNEIKHNNVIGKAGKGFRAQIAFDLNDPMGRSSCVSCGECMFSCPTDALTLKPHRRFESEWSREMRDAGAQPVTGSELRVMHPLFGSVPPKYLEWNASAAVRRKLNAGDVLCHQGDHGATAFLLLSGRFGIFEDPRITRREARERQAASGLFQGLLSAFWRERLPEANGAADEPDAPAVPPADLLDVVRQLSAHYGDFKMTREPKDVILGEMSCLNYKPRSATVVALDPGCEVIEIRRNILFMLQRNPEARDQLRALYTDRALAFDVPQLSFLRHLPRGEKQACVQLLRQRIELLQVEPGGMIFQQGAISDCLYVVRSGYVRFWHEAHGKRRILTYEGPGKVFGEVGLLDQMRKESGAGAAGAAADLLGRRTLNCNALDHVELLRIDRQTFEAIREASPALRREFDRIYQEHRSYDLGPPAADLTRRESFVQQGLYNAQEMLVLDLARCTRCDECSKACSDTHGGTTRLIRDGLRVENFLVASACRACEDPYCLVGCPVDAIHRGSALDIRIESHCIGCGLCAQNCPYGNINMVPDTSSPEQDRQRATTCDLCTSLSGTKIRGRKPGLEVSCVNACPHEAAFRMTGAELWDRLARATPES